MLDPFEVPVSGHISRTKRRSGDRWMAKWRDAEGQHQRVIARVWVGRGRPADGYLTKRGAQRVLDELLAEARRGQLPGVTRRAALLTFAEAAEDYLDYLEHDRCRRPSTIRDYRVAIEKVLYPALGADTQLRAMTTQRIDAWRGRMVRRGAAGSTINKHLLILNGIFKRAQRKHGLSINPVVGVERQPVRRSGDFRVLSPPEVQALVRAAVWPQDGVMYVVAAYAGLRTGELLALRWCDVDFAKALIHVRRSYTKDHEDAPKSGRVRSVPMVDQVARVLDGLSRRDGFTGENDLVFPNEIGRHMDGSAMRRRFYESLQRGGVKRVRFHDLRHSFGTLAVQVFPLTDVKAYMGHADISTTMIYVHHVPQHDAAAKLSAALEEAVGAGRGLADRSPLRSVRSDSGGLA